MTSTDAVLTVIDAFADIGVPNMMESLSTCFYGVPHCTQDADFVIQPEGDSFQRLAQRLGSSFRLRPQQSSETVTGTYRYILNAVDVSFQIELFFLSNDAHDQERFARRRRVNVLGRSSFVASAEDVIITKLRWSQLGKRQKDVDDVRNVLAVQGDRIDWPYVYAWCDRHGTRALLDEIRRSIPPL